jgi:hypothetical protein
MTKKLLPLALFGLAFIAAPAAADTHKELQKACLKADSADIDALHDKSRELGSEDGVAFAKAAVKTPRALLVAPMAHWVLGERLAAREELAALIGKLPDRHKARKNWAELLQRIDQSRALYPGHDSRLATRDYWPGEAREVTAADGGKYRLQVWLGTACGGASLSQTFRAGLEVFRLESDGRVKSLWAHEEETYGFEIMGVLAEGPDADPMVAVTSWPAGTCNECAQASTLLVREAGPVWIDGGALGGTTIEGIADIDKDGAPEFVTTVPGWNFYMDLCRNCSPRLSAIFTLQGSEIVEACTRFPGSFEERASGALQNDDPRAPLQDVAGAVVTVFLNMVQAGKEKEAEVWLKDRLSPQSAGGDKAYAKKLRDDLLARLAKVRAGEPRGCPANSL